MSFVPAEWVKDLQIYSNNLYIIFINKIIIIFTTFRLLLSEKD